jgi:hypothetical protein
MIATPVLLDIPLAAGTRAARPLDEFPARGVGGFVGFLARPGRLGCVVRSVAIRWTHTEGKGKGGLASGLAGTEMGMEGDV